VNIDPAGEWVNAKHKCVWCGLQMLVRLSDRKQRCSNDCASGLGQCPEQFLPDDAATASPCIHTNYAAGPQISRRYGSWATEICVGCGAWRTMGHVNGAHLSEWKSGPMPTDLDPEE